MQHYFHLEAGFFFEGALSGQFGIFAAPQFLLSLMKKTRQENARHPRYR
jgi:hypothetical protein